MFNRVIFPAFDSAAFTLKYLPSQVFDDALDGERIFPTHFFSQKHLIFIQNEAHRDKCECEI